MCATRIAAATDQGPRENLEDSFAASTLSLPLLSGGKQITACLVNDGVGGNHHGEVASDYGIDCISSSIMASFGSARPTSNTDLFASDRVLSVIKSSLAYANESVLRQIESNPDLEGMSTTAVCTIIVDGMLFVGWVGDSACFLYNSDHIRKVTRDHSEVQRLIDAGLLSEDDANSHPLSHVITRFIGQPTDFCPETNTHHLVDGDVVLLCTDGLTDVLSNEDIAACVNACRQGEFPFPELPKHLVDQALMAGTQDNVTVLCCEYHDEPEQAGLTTTGAYPAAAAQAIQNLHKETSNV